MGLFGRKKSAPPGRSSTYPDTLDVGDRADIDWIRSSGDPLVWHDAALACLLFRGDQHDLVPWLAEQPDLDRVTAAAIFLHRSNGVAHLEGRGVEHVDMEPEQVVRAIETLCELDGTRTLREHGIGMYDEWDAERQATFDQLQGHPRAPLGILARPFPAQTAEMPYVDLGEGELVSRSYAHANFPFMLG